MKRHPFFQTDNIVYLFKFYYYLYYYSNTGYNTSSPSAERLSRLQYDIRNSETLYKIIWSVDLQRGQGCPRLERRRACWLREAKAEEGDFPAEVAKHLQLAAGRRVYR